MNNPYETPKSESQIKEKDPHVKLLGVAMKKNNYIVLQISLFSISLLAAIGFGFIFTNVKILGYSSDQFAVGFVVLAMLEIGESLYALNKKVIYK